MSESAESASAQVALKAVPQHKKPRPSGLRPWPKGVSGNPGGRKPGLEQMCRKHTAAAINALVRALRVPQTRVPAAVALLDRGWGKPLQSVEVNGKTTLELHLIAARMVSGQLLEGSIAAEVEAEVLPAPDGEVVPTE